MIPQLMLKRQTKACEHGHSHERHASLEDGMGLTSDKAFSGNMAGSWPWPLPGPPLPGGPCSAFVCVAKRPPLAILPPIPSRSHAKTPH